MNDRAKNTGVKSINQEFAKYEQVTKDQTYGLSELDSVDSFDDDYEIKTCDISKWISGTAEEKAQFAADFGAALEDIGFAIITDHGVDPALYDEMTEETIKFFETIPMEERTPYLAERHGSVNQGYFPVKKTTIIHPDLVEGWVFCRRAFNLDNDPTFNEHQYWPKVGLEKKYRKVVKAHEALILPLMQSILTYLGCEPHLYDEKLDATNFGFRLNYYPAITKEQQRAKTGRMLGHEDIDLFTILPASNQSGLQVLNRQTMKWIRLHPPKGSIIINTGDYMQRITNDRLPSTTHRVSSPPLQEQISGPRVSIPLAVYVWENEILEVLPGLGEPKYPPVRAEDFHTKITSKYYGDDYRGTGTSLVSDEE